MTAPTLAALALGAMIPEAHPLDREAGGVHQPLVWYAENGIEPSIELADLCSDAGPWYCTDTDMLRARVSSSVIARCDPKSCPPDAIPAALSAPWMPASGWVYPPFHNSASPVLGARSAFGGFFGGGSRSGSETTERVETIRERETIIREDCGCPDPDPDGGLTPVPLPASLPLLAGALLILRRFAR